MILCAPRRKFLRLLVFLPCAALAAEPVRVDLSISRRKPEGGVRTVRVARNETIELRVRADEPMGIHVHGYDLELGARPGNVASVTFAARLVGRFPVTAHLHDAKGARKGHEPALLYIEVHPR